jgi:beta-phosphoglucomutase-like phosphatase (HAD superfamily)
MLPVNKLEKIEKVLGKETSDELMSFSPDQLKARIISAETAMKQAIEELEANPKYQELKESLKALSSGLRDVKKRQNAVIQYALHLLGE